MHNRLRRWLVPCLIFFSVLSAYAADPDPLAVRARSLWLPGGLGSVLIHSDEAVHPSTQLELPHALADVRETVFGGSGGGVAGNGANGASLGIGLPLRQAVVGAAIGYLGDAEGSLGRVGLTVARPVGARLAAGAGARLGWATSNAGTDIGGAFDVGLRYRVGGIGDLSRIEFHAALQGAGRSERREGTEPLTGAFSPLLGARARLYDSERLDLDGALELRLDTATGPWIAGAASLRFAGGLEASLGADLPLQVSEGRLWPGLSLGLTVPLSSAPREGTSVRLAVRPEIAGTVLLAGSFRTRFPSSDLEAPELGIEVQQPRPIEMMRFPIPAGVPVNDRVPQSGLSSAGDRSQMVVRVVANDQRAIAAIDARVRAPDGALIKAWSIRQIGSTEVGGSVSQRLTSDLAPRQLDGTLVLNLDEFPIDGRYVMEVSARDRAGNVTSGPDIPIYLDREAPEIALVQQSPVAGVDDQSAVGPEQPAEMRLAVSDAELLQVRVIDESGSTVRLLDAVPEDGRPSQLAVRWDGSGPDGLPVADGVYRVAALAEDAVGNRSEAVSGELLFRSVRPVFRLAVDRRLLNGETTGTDRELSVRARLEPLPGLQDWRIELLRLGADGSEIESVRSWSGIDLPPERILLDSRVFPEDGNYRLRGSSRYVGGARAMDESEVIRVDRQGPVLEAALSVPRIGPEDPRSLLVFLEGRDVREGELLLLGDPGSEPTPVLRFDGAPDRLEWSLVGPDGRFLEPGVYRLAVAARDASGNRSRSSDLTVELLARLSGAEISALANSVSPDGNGIGDDLGFALRGPADALSGRFAVTIEGSGATRQLSGDLPVPGRITWDGRDDAGLPFPDGTVRATLEVAVPGRGSVTAQSGPVRVDTRGPRVALARLGAGVISPDGDGVQDELRISIELDDAEVAELVWSAPGSGAELLRQAIDPEDVQVAAEGGLELVPRGPDGRLFADGRYELRLVARDAAGNTGSAGPVPVDIDTRPVSGFVRLSAGAISPNGDGISDRIQISPVITDQEGLENWSIAALGPDGARTVLASGDGPGLPAELGWPGDESVPDGEYRIELRGSYRHGPVLEALSPRVRVDTQAPVVSVSARPQPFSPDGDGRDDVVRWQISVEDASPLAFWLLEIEDSRGAFFYDLGGEGAPPPALAWDGRARNGELVLSAEVYPYRLTIADTLGNRSEISDELLVDVLVEPIEGGYRIRVPRITFPGNSAELILDPADPRGAQNRAVIDRVVEILGRFPDYEIVVEGHAVNLSGTQAEEERELVPLSRARAASVRDALIDRGVAAGLLSARGRGGSMPLVPHSDEENRWKNRRVDFILQR